MNGHKVREIDSAVRIQEKDVEAGCFFSQLW